MALTISVLELVERSKNPLLGKRDSWGRVRLGDIAVIQNGFPFKSEQFTSDNGMPLIRIRDVGADQSNTYYVGDYDPAFVVNPGDLLVGMDGDFNCARWRGPPGLLNQRVCRILLKSDKYHPRLLDYALPGYLKAINEMTSSVTVKHLSSKSIADIPLPLPPVEEQIEIVSEIEKQFSRLDEAVANLTRVKANLKRYKAAVLKAAVEGRLVETEAEIARREGRSYETGAELLKRILDARRKNWKGKGKYREPVPPDTSDLPELPEGWTWATMPQLGEISRGKSRHRPRDDAKLYGGPYPFIQTGEIRKSEGSITQWTQTYSELGLAQSRLWPSGTLCITIAANIAETGILKFDACFPDSVVGFISNGREIATHYIEYFLRIARQELDRFAPATAQKNINVEVLECLAIPLPPTSEQHRIVLEVDRCLTNVVQVESEVARVSRRSRMLFSSVLQQAFSIDSPR